MLLLVESTWRPCFLDIRETGNEVCAFASCHHWITGDSIHDARSLLFSLRTSLETEQLPCIYLVAAFVFFPSTCIFTSKNTFISNSDDSYLFAPLHVFYHTLSSTLCLNVYFSVLLSYCHFVYVSFVIVIHLAVVVVLSFAS